MARKRKGKLRRALTISAGGPQDLEYEGDPIPLYVAFRCTGCDEEIIPPIPSPLIPANHTVNCSNCSRRYSYGLDGSVTPLNEYYQRCAECDSDLTATQEFFRFDELPEYHSKPDLLCRRCVEHTLVRKALHVEKLKDEINSIINALCPGTQEEKDSFLNLLLLKE